MFEGQRGVSVAPTPENCTDGLHELTYGIISVKVGWIRDAGYDVVPDSPTHVNIVGLPARTEELKIQSTGEANRIARLAPPYDPPAIFKIRTLPFCVDGSGKHGTMVLLVK